MLFSADSSRLVTASRYGSGPIRLINTAAGEEITVIADNDDITQVAFSANGEQVMIVLSDTVRLFSSQSGEAIARLAHNWPIQSAIMNGSGQELRLATLSEDGAAVALWAPTTSAKEPLYTLRFEHAVEQLALTAAGDRLVTSGADFVTLWNSADGAELFTRPFPTGIHSVKVGGNGSYLAVLALDKTVHFIDSRTGAETPNSYTHDYEPDHFGNMIISPDGLRLAAVYSNTLQLLDLTTAQVITEVMHQGRVFQAAFSPHPETPYVVSASLDGEVQVRDQATGALLATLANSNIGSEIYIAPTGSRLAVVTNNHTVTVWEPTQGEKLAVLPHEERIFNVIFPAIRSRVLTVSGDGSANAIHLWAVDQMDGNKIANKLRDLGCAGSLYSYRVNGVQIALTGLETWNNFIRTRFCLWDVEPASQIISFYTDDRYVSPSFSPDGTRVAAGGESGLVRLWTTEGGLEPKARRLHEEVAQVVIDGADMRLVTTSETDTVRLRSLDGAEVRAVSFDHAVWPTANFDGSRLVITEPDYPGSAGTAIYLLDGFTKQRLNGLSTTYGLGNARGRPIQFSPDGKQVFVYDWYGNVATLWDSEDGHLIAKLSPSGSNGNGVLFSPDSVYVVGYGDSNLVDIWRSADGERYTSLEHDSVIGAIAFSPDQVTLATGGSLGVVHLWDIANKTEVGTLVHPVAVTALLFDPSGAQLAAVTTDQTVYLWDVGKRTLQQRLQHPTPISLMAYCDDGTQLATADEWQIRLWDTKNGEELSVLRVAERLATIKFSNNCHDLVGVTENGGIYQWQLDNLDNLIEIACHSLSRNLEQAEWNIYVGAETPYRRTCVEYPAPYSVIQARFKRAQAAGGALDAIAHRFIALLELDTLDDKLATQTRETAAQVFIDESWVSANGGKLDEVNLLTQKALQINPTYDVQPVIERARQEAANLLQRQGEALARQGNVVEAQHSFTEALALNPELDLDPRAYAQALAAQTEADPLYIKGRTLVNGHQITEALALLAQAWSISPTPPFAISHYGLAYDGSGPMEVSAALPSDLAPVTAAQRLAASELGVQAEARLQAGETEEALALFQNVLQLNPDFVIDPKAYMEKKKATFIQQQIEEGRRLVNQTLYPRAITLYTQLIERFPDEDEIYVARGAAYQRQQEYRLAFADFATAIALHGDSLEYAYAGRGLVSFKLAEFDEGMLDMQAAMALAPDQASYYNLACWEGTLLQHAAAVMAYCERAVTLEPDNGTLRDSRGIARALVSDIAGAVADFTFFITWAKETEYAGLIQQRKEWIRRLNNHEQPDVVFDAETLKELRTQ